MTCRLPFALALTLGVGACVSYRAEPLDSDPHLLAPPVVSVLARDAAAFRRPFLHTPTIDLAAPLNANAIATIAVMANPDLKAMRVRAGIADAQVFAARLLPDPTFSIGIDHLLSGPDPVDNIAGALGLDLAALRTRRVAREKARAEARQVRLDLAWAEWQSAGQARIQAARIAGLERGLALASASRAAAQSLLDRS